MAADSPVVADSIVLFTHLPKAGGSTVGALLSASVQSTKITAALRRDTPCHLLWNGLDRASVCDAVRTWLRNKSKHLQAGKTPLSDGAGSSAANASLATATPFLRCATLWAQHVDYSLVELAREYHPKLAIHPVMMLRHPVELFFSEYLYKRHCLWRQQGRRAPDANSGLSLPQHIARLRREPARRTLLMRFLAGASWCSCARDWETRRVLPLSELRDRAIANAHTYAVLGSLRRASDSLHQIDRLLHHFNNGSHRASGEPSRAAGPSASVVNALDRCVEASAVPATDLPTATQRAEVATLMAADVRLYEELERRAVLF